MIQTPHLSLVSLLPLGCLVDTRLRDNSELEGDKIPVFLLATSLRFSGAAFADSNSVQSCCTRAEILAYCNFRERKRFRTYASHR